MTILKCLLIFAIIIIITIKVSIVVVVYLAKKAPIAKETQEDGFVITEKEK